MGALYRSIFGHSPKILWLLFEDFGSRFDLELYILPLRPIHELASVASPKFQDRQPFIVPCQ